MHPATPIRELAFCAIDFESAGAARGANDVPVQVGLARWSAADGHQHPFDSYLRSERPITWAARRVHGIEDRDLVDAPSLLELWPTLRQALAGRVVVAHGKGTEKRFLRAFPGHGFGPWIDTLPLARAAWPEAESHALSELCARAGLADRVAELVPARRWHDALYDATASLVLLERLLADFDLLDAPLQSLLHPDTSAWHRHRHS